MYKICVLLFWLWGAAFGDYLIKKRTDMRQYIIIQMLANWVQLQWRFLLEPGNHRMALNIIMKWMGKLHAVAIIICQYI